MDIAVVIRQVPDLIEPLEIDSSCVALDLSSATFLVNESDDHALEQALLIKESSGGTVSVVALDAGDVDNMLYTAAAKGADRIVKIAQDGEPPSPRASASVYAAAIKALGPDLVLVGIQAHDEFDGGLAPFLAGAMGLPYIGVIRGVRPGAGQGTANVCKEFPGAVMAQMTVKLPAVLGVVGAEQPPRYVPVAKIRAAMKSAAFEEEAAGEPAAVPSISICRLEPPVSGRHAEMLSGSDEEMAAKVAGILAQKGLRK